MLLYPLHPAIIHFPVVLAFLLPILALGALWAIRKGTTARRAWTLLAALSAALASSAWVAVQTGEAQDERVERVVAEPPLETHEEAAELFLTLSGVLVLVTAAGLAPGMVGRAARGLATGGAVALVILAANVGHSGGALVYRYGAASAYTEPGVTSASAPTALAEPTVPAAHVADERPRAR